MWCSCKFQCRTTIIGNIRRPNFLSHTGKKPIRHSLVLPSRHHEGVVAWEHSGVKWEIEPIPKGLGDCRNSRSKGNGSRRFVLVVLLLRRRDLCPGDKSLVIQVLRKSSQGTSIVKTAESSNKRSFRHERTSVKGIPLT